MSNSIGMFLPSNFDHPLCNQRAGDAAAKVVWVLVNRSRLNHWTNEIAGKLLSQIVDVDYGCARLPGFLVQTFKLLFLSNVGAEGDHLGLVFVFEPGEQHGGIEASGIG